MVLGRRAGQGCLVDDQQVQIVAVLDAMALQVGCSNRLRVALAAIIHLSKEVKRFRLAQFNQASPRIRLAGVVTQQRAQTAHG